MYFNTFLKNPSNLKCIVFIILYAKCDFIFANVLNYDSGNLLNGLIKFRSKKANTIPLPTYS
jgi:hypothetical protein